MKKMRKNIITFILLSITLFINCSNVLAKDEGVGIQIDMLPWEKVYKILPKYSKFTVLDVETGKSFMCKDEQEVATRTSSP